MSLKRDFEINGIRYHLNDNPIRNEFSSRYVLLFWHDGYERNQVVSYVDTKKEAIALAKKHANGRM